MFNQPGVANAIETQFVPVKLNADENSATATWYGITRVPTDVIVTPDGQIVAKLISPPTPAAYVAEVTAAAGKICVEEWPGVMTGRSLARSTVANEFGVREFAGAADGSACGRRRNSILLRSPIQRRLPLHFRMIHSLRSSRGWRCRLLQCPLARKQRRRKL